MPSRVYRLLYCKLVLYFKTSHGTCRNLHIWPICPETQVCTVGGKHICNQWKFFKYIWTQNNMFISFMYYYCTVISIWKAINTP